MQCTSQHGFWAPIICQKLKSVLFWKNTTTSGMDYSVLAYLILFQVWYARWTHSTPARHRPLHGPALDPGASKQRRCHGNLPKNLGASWFLHQNPFGFNKGENPCPKCFNKTWEKVEGIKAFTQHVGFVSFWSPGVCWFSTDPPLRSWKPIEVVVTVAKAVLEDIPYMHIPDDKPHVWWRWDAEPWMQRKRLNLVRLAQDSVRYYVHIHIIDGQV